MCFSGRREGMNSWCGCKKKILWICTSVTTITRMFTASRKSEYVYIFVKSPKGIDKSSEMNQSTSVEQGGRK